MLITMNIVVSLPFMIDRMGQPSLWLLSSIFVPLTFFMAVGLLRAVKGGTIGLMLSLNTLRNDANPV
jgi:uncharacterized protein (DUF983 family)